MAHDYTVVNTPNGYMVAVRDFDGDTTFAFEDIFEKMHELTAQLTISTEYPGEPAETFTERINVMSSSAKEGLRRNLDAIWERPKGHWTGVLNKACEAMRVAHRERDWSRDLSTVEAEMRTTYLLRPLIPHQGHTIWFGAGESGKTYIALATALSVAYGTDSVGYDYGPQPVLFIDYESDEQIIKRRLERIARGLEIELSPAFYREMFHYWPGRGPIASMIPALRRKAEQGVALMVVDSAALAAGGSPLDEQVALGYFNAIRAVGIPCVTLAHMTKAEDDRHPLGSIFWHTSARATWLVKAAEEQLNGTKRLGFYQRKGNEDERHEPVGFELHFGEETTEVRRTEIRGELSEYLALPVRIRKALLGRGKLKLKEIVSEVGGKPDSVYKSLKRMPDVMSEGVRGSPDTVYFVLETHRDE